MCQSNVCCIANPPLSTAYIGTVPYCLQVVIFYHASASTPVVSLVPFSEWTLIHCALIEYITGCDLHLKQYKSQEQLG